MASFSTFELPLIVRQHQNVLFLEFNRPKALNALSLEMCIQIKNLLLESINSSNNTIGAFVMKGCGGKAFCAGGDVKSVWKDVVELDSQNMPIGTGQPGQLHTDFFREEYTMNYLLGTSLKPQVSLWDGIVMGGGVGVSVLGEFRVATEKSMFAMPETAIGIFPDVGSSAWLPQLPDGYGNYIGLTGARFNAADLLHSGIATHYVDSDKLAALEEELAHVPINPAESRQYIRNVLNKYQSDSNQPDISTSHVAANALSIKKCFGTHVTSVEEIIQNLTLEESQGNEWAKKTLHMLHKMCPTSLKLTFAQLQRGKSLDLQGCLEMEFRMIMRCMCNTEFREGIRSVLIDKDHSPKWNPSRLEEVTQDMIDSYFEPLKSNELNLSDYKLLHVFNN